MRRREFIAGLGGAAAAWPRAVCAQRPTMPVIGHLDFGSPAENSVASFRQGLSETGYVEGRNVAIEFRWAHNDIARLPELAADLVRRRVAVIAAWSSTAVAVAVKAETNTIPIVFQIGDDPVQFGLVASLARPGGNATGMTSMNAEIMGKRLGLLHELLPGGSRFALLSLQGRNLRSLELLIEGVQSAAAAVGVQIEVLTAGTDRDIDTAFESLVQKRIDGLLVGPFILFAHRQVQIVNLAARHAVPAIYFDRSFAEAGGLMSYGQLSYDDMARQGGIYVGRILNGEKPADLPVMRPTRFELVINLRTAKKIGVNVPRTLLVTAAEVIE